jgi:glycosyltransferase involved in cell wall biosynthesis
VTSLRIAQVAPVATSVPPGRSGSIESATALLTEGLVRHGHQVTLFATADSQTSARLHATFPRGYYPMSLAFTRMTPTPILQTLHHAPDPAEVALWRRYPHAPFIAISGVQAMMLDGLNVAATIPHAIDMERFTFRDVPDDYLVFLGRFTPGKGVIEAIDIARRARMRLVLAAAENDYYHETVSRYVDGRDVVYAGEVDHQGKVALLGGARALLYPVQAAEPFGLVLAEAMACGTPVAALGLGAVPELVDQGVTGHVFQSVDAMVDGLAAVCALARPAVRAAAMTRFGIDRMVTAHVDAYRKILSQRPSRPCAGN